MPLDWWLERNQTWIVLSHHPQGTSFSSPSPYDIITKDSIITNLANQEAEIDIRMEDIILEADLEEEYQNLQVEESDSKQTDINDYD
ncbi:hypothetical protein AVEN_227105-1 [Araneus ventricosus]|uniref:Uncharacterized protein n=1 Tax=Araneus ventricosus TaxID=182803 RepID=A0A4Y2BWK5_ARAVE|nr:hypothetical protein AVEN_227105-1 [Araneus ventricosus]